MNQLYRRILENAKFKNKKRDCKKQPRFAYKIVL